MHTRFFLLFFALTAALSLANAQEDNFSADRIPTELIRHASAVIRKRHSEIRIVSGSEVYYYQRYAVTILNEKGSKYAVFNEHYDNFSEIESVRGWLYDGQGKEITRMKKPDLKDVGASGENVYDEDRYKKFDFQCHTYPYTCEFEEKIRINTTFIVPGWYPQDGYDCAVENADVMINYPVNMDVKYRTYHIKDIPSVTLDGEQKKITLGIKNIPARGKPDEFTPDENYFGPALRCVVNKFLLEDMEGSLLNWNGLGKFIYGLNAGRDELPDNVKKVVHQLVDTCTNTYKKTSLLYQYLQKNTRYVNIVLGVGGWRTWDARHVAEKGYGDCKALSNYMKALLKEAGITAYQALVFAGEHPKKMEADFACNIFNHVILCVPKQEDTMWLECTAKELPAGSLSSFTADRDVLLLSPGGGFMVRTPAYNEMVNVIARKATMAITANDEITGTIDGSYEGSWWADEYAEIREGKSRADDYFNRKFAIPTYKVDNYVTSQTVSNYLPTLNEHIRVHGTGCVTRSGKLMYISPHILKFSVVAPFSYDPRKDSFQLSQSYQVIDTTVITLGGRYTPQTVLMSINRDYTFASYHSKVLFDGDSTLKVCVYYEQKKGIYPSRMFEDYISLSREINTNAAYSQVLLAKKE